MQAALGMSVMATCGVASSLDAVKATLIMPFDGSGATEALLAALRSGWRFL